MAAYSAADLAGGADFLSAARAAKGVRHSRMAARIALTAAAGSARKACEMLGLGCLRCGLMQG